MVISYGRFNKDNKIVVVCNNSHEEKTVKIPVWEIGINSIDGCQQIFETTPDGFETDALNYEIIKGKIEVTLKAFSSKIIKEKVTID